MTAQSKRVQLPPCDLVMKGGATSGVVYPPVIVELAEKYRFNNIGGTSAGAIAATMTAAAEYGRARGHLSDFSQLNGLSSEMSSEGYLLRLFRSSAPAHLRPLLDTLLPLVSNAEEADQEAAPSGQPFAIPWVANWLAPELIELLMPKPEPGQVATDPQMGRKVARLVTDLKHTHPYGYTAGHDAGGLIAIRLGQVLIGAALVLALIFAIPLLVIGAPLNALIAWAVIAALLIGLAFVASRMIGDGLAGSTGAVVAVTDLGRALLNELPQNLYGICTGRRQPDVPDSEPALIDWLNQWVAKLAGPTPASRPLTFGDLEHEGISLRVVTTNLSHGRPYVLPFESDFILLIQRKDAELLFPQAIVDYLCEERHLYPGWSLEQLNDGLGPHDPARFMMLPNSDDLPVIVGMRMSLSFPVLISAVRLYTVSGNCPAIDGIYTPAREHLQENWFSDGGICSNFPIHFFDSWLPAHPTFGINLTGLPKDAFGSVAGGPITKSTDVAQNAPVQPDYVSQIAPKAPMMPVPAVKDADSVLAENLGLKSVPQTGSTIRVQNPGARVFLPDAEQPLDPLWRPVEDLTRFVWTMFDTAMNYRDITQLMLPSYKERAVQIRLDGTREGGLNLTMSQETVDKLQRYGREAGSLLRDRFDFDRHRWVRFRVLMGELERQLLSLDTPLSALANTSLHTTPYSASMPGGDDTMTLYEQLMRSARAEAFPFGDVAEPRWVYAANVRMRALRTLIAAWRDANRMANTEDGQRRINNLTEIHHALLDTWRRKNFTPEESERLARQVIAALEKLPHGTATPTASVGRENRFFKQVSNAELQLRVTPDL